MEEDGPAPVWKLESQNPATLPNILNVFIMNRAGLINQLQNFLLKPIKQRALVEFTLVLAE